MTRASQGPLHGLVRVADWTQFGVGPFATALLGALGADVIKIENPPRGDPQAYIPPTVNGIAGLYLNYNTSKRSIFLNLHDQADKQVMWDLLADADLFVNNLRPGSVARAGLHEDVVLERYPGLVYVLSNGYGEEGPRAEEGGGDNWLQVFCGWCSITGEEGGRWEFLRYLGHIDLNTSMYITAAALTGLAARERLGGQSIRISMLDAGVSMQANRIAEYLNGGARPEPLGSASSVVAPGQAFECADREYIAVVVECDSQWRRLCDAIERPDLLTRPEYATNADRVAKREELAGELADVFRIKPLEWWNQQLTKAKVPNSRFWDWELIKVHPQVVENEHLVLIDTGPYGFVYTGGPPWKFEESPCRIESNPAIGEHSDEVRAEIAERVGKRDVSPNGSQPDNGVLPFDGLRVVELSTGVSGPYCGSLLADQGARVIKVEPPDGDRVRFWGPPFIDDVSPAFLELNRNKEILAGEHDLEALVKDADVVIVDAVDPDGNPPTIDLRALRRAKPELVVCSISAYGERGPFADQPGAELCVQAMCNTWAGLGQIGEPPRRLGADQASMNAGVAAYQGIVAALIRREHTGRGDRVETSALGTHHSVKGMHWVCLSNPDQWPGLHLSVWTDPPNYGVRTRDRPVLLMPSSGVPKPDSQSQERIESLIRHFGGEVPPELDMTAPWGTPGHFLHYRWYEFWSELLQDVPSEEVGRVVEEHGGRATPFLDYAAFETDPHMQVVQPFAPLEGGAEGRRVVRLPWKLRGVKRALRYREPITVTEFAWRSPGEPVAGQVSD